MLLRSTQTSSQKMDFEIVSALSGSKIHYAGEVENTFRNHAAAQRHRRESDP